MFARGEMTLSRVDEICRVLRTDYADLSRKVADAAPMRHELTAEQEAAVVADPKLLLVAICVMSQWTLLEQMVGTYRLTEAEGGEVPGALDQAGRDRCGRANRYRLHVAKRLSAGGPTAW